MTKKGQAEICKTRTAGHRKRYVPSDCKWCGINFCQQRDEYNARNQKNLGDFAQQKLDLEEQGK
jgi:hypothetical protein